MGKLTISMAIFNSCLYVYQRVIVLDSCRCPLVSIVCSRRPRWTIITNHIYSIQIFWALKHVYVLYIYTCTYIYTYTYIHIYIYKHISHMCVAIDLDGDLISQWIEAFGNTPSRCLDNRSRRWWSFSAWPWRTSSKGVVKSFEQCDPQSGFLTIKTSWILWVKHTQIQLLNIHGILVTHGFILGHMFFVIKNVGMESRSHGYSSSPSLRFRRVREAMG